MHGTKKQGIERGGKQDRSAILRWREQLLQLDSGENIYERFTYPNPPIMALMLRPLAELPPIAGALTWFYMKVALAVLSFIMIVRMIGTETEPFPPWAIGLAVLLSLRPVLSDLTHGNINLLILFLVISALFAYRSGWDVFAGIVLALAIACKVTPALFIAYFVWKRAWRCLAGCGIGLALFFLVIPAFYLGWAENLEFLTSWFRQMVLPYVIGGAVTSDHPNQSLPGLVVRMLTRSPSFSTWADGPNPFGGPTGWSTACRTRREVSTDSTATEPNGSPEPRGSSAISARGRRFPLATRASISPSALTPSRTYAIPCGSVRS